MSNLIPEPRIQHACTSPEIFPNTRRKRIWSLPPGVRDQHFSKGQCGEPPRDWSQMLLPNPPSTSSPTAGALTRHLVCPRPPWMTVG